MKRSIRVLSAIDFLRLSNIPFKFLVPYSPESNPIEEFFAMVYSRFHSVRIQHKVSIETAIANVMDFRVGFFMECNNFYRNMRRWLERARRLEHFI
jgi:hypothetical protein